MGYRPACTAPKTVVAAGGLVNPADSVVAAAAATTSDIVGNRVSLVHLVNIERPVRRRRGRVERLYR